MTDAGVLWEVYCCKPKEENSNAFGGKMRVSAFLFSHIYVHEADAESAMFPRKFHSTLPGPCVGIMPTPGGV